MTDILRRLQEPPFGTETSERNIMTAAANEIISLRADTTYLGKFLLDLREKLSLFVDEIEDEGDRVYLGSSNHADYLREAEERMTEIWYEAEDKIGMFAKDRDLYAEMRELREHNDDLVEALKTLRDYGCPVCSGDCASANPPVDNCPMHLANAAIAKATP